MKLKGATFLKVMGILLIIAAAFAIIAGIMALVGVGALHSIANDALDSLDALAGEGSTADIRSEINPTMLYLASALVLISGVAELISGIKGVGGSKHPEKAGGCVGWGVVVAVLAVLGQILNVVGGSKFDIVSLITGLVLPVLYIIAAVQLKGAYANAGQQTPNA